MKKSIFSYCEKIVKANYKMWWFLKEKKIAQNPLILYRALYLFKIRLGQYLALKKYRKDGLFVSVHIETCAYCNRKCSFCLNSDRYPNRELGFMPIKLWKKIIDELSEIKYKGKISPYYYGEPFLDKRLSEMISYAKKKCPYSYIQLNSNGDFLTEKLLLDLIENGVDKILVTNYGKVGIPKNTPKINIEKENKRLEYLYNKYPQFLRLRGWKAIDFVNRRGLVFKRPNLRKNDPCLYPSYQLVIDWKGDVLLCCNDYYAEFVMGNAAKESILDIWKTQRFKNFRDVLKSGKREKIKICADCDVIGDFEY